LLLLLALGLDLESEIQPERIFFSGNSPPIWGLVDDGWPRSPAVTFPRNWRRAKKSLTPGQKHR